MKTFCDNCGRDQVVYECLLKDESGTAQYCTNCITNNPHAKPEKKLK